MSILKFVPNFDGLGYREDSLTKPLPSRILLWVIAALLCGVTATATAFGVGTGHCDPTKDVCIIVVTDSSIPQHTHIINKVGYDMNNTYYPMYDDTAFIDPNKTYVAINLPVNFLDTSRFKGLIYIIDQTGASQSDTSCKVVLPFGHKPVPTTITLKLSFDYHTYRFVCGIN